MENKTKNPTTLNTHWIWKLRGFGKAAVQLGATVQGIRSDDRLLFQD